MTSIRRLALPAALVLLGLAAVPAHATLLVRSDGNGLFVMDKNGISDSAHIFGDTLDGQTAYRVTNNNSLDAFKFDRQVGCEKGSNDAVSICQRNGPKINVQLAGGNDFFNMSLPTAVPIGDSSVAGGLGNDTVLGHAGTDQLHGQSGEDELKGGAGNDGLFGGEASDQLEGGNGNDTLEGGNGADVLIGGKGGDILRGNPGNDFINAKEPSGSGVADEIGCGGGSDTLEADLVDVVPASCEEFEQSPVGETPHVSIRGKSLRVSSTGRVRVRLRCPRGVKSLGCNGRLQLRLDRASSSAGASRSRRVRYRIRAGRSKTVTLQLTRADVRTLRGKRRRGVLTSVERGRIGPKTTIRNPRLKLRR